MGLSLLVRTKTGMLFVPHRRPPSLNPPKARIRGLSSQLLVRYSPVIRIRCSHCVLGADDDGSGTMSILEAYRALIASGFRPERSVEFHWYSAEVCQALCLRGALMRCRLLPQEGGLLGSQVVAQAYENRDANVVAMSQVCAC